MHATLLLSLSVLTVFTSAAAALERRQPTCSTAYPKYIFQLVSDTPSINTYSPSRTIVPKGFSGTLEYVTEVHFDPLPKETFQHGACRLQLYFPAKARLETNPDSHRLSVYKLKSAGTTADSWSSHSASDFLAGTVDVVRADSDKETVFEINSPACSVAGDGTVGFDYRIEINNSAGFSRGFIQWWQESGAGLRVLYNC